MVTLRFACNHVLEIARAETGTARPICPICGERRVRHTAAPAPRFRGVCEGPHARTEALEAMPMMLAQDGPLRLKE